MIEINENLMAVFDSMSSGIEIYNQNGLMMYCNDADLEIYGIPFKDIFLDKKLRLFDNVNIPANLIPAIIRGENIAFRGKYSFDIVKKNNYFDTTKNGSVYFEIKCKSIVSSSSERLGFIVETVDVTAEELAKKEIKHKDQKLNMLINATGLVAWEFDCETREFKSLNNSWFLSSSDKNVTFEDYLKFVPDAHKYKFEALRDIMYGRQDVSFSKDGVFLNPVSGKEMFITFAGQVLDRAADGRVLSYIGYTHDFSQKKLMFNEIQEANKKLELQNKTNSLILNNIDSGLVFINKNRKIEWTNLHHFNRLINNFQIRNYEVGGNCIFNVNGFCTIVDDICSPEAFIERHKNIRRECHYAGDSVASISHFPLKNSISNELEGVLIKIDDITEQRNNHRRLIESQNQTANTNKILHEIINNMPAVLFIKDVKNDFRFKLVNDLFCSSIGLKVSDVIGHSENELFYASLVKKYRMEDNEAICTQKPVSFENTVVAADGSKSVWNGVKVYIKLLSGDEYIIGLSMDVTSLKKAYRDLDFARVKAIESDKLKSSIIANLSHEIRTPLNAIGGFSELLFSEPVSDEDKNEFVNIIQTNIDSLLKIVDNLLKISIMESGSLESEFENFDLSIMFTEIYTMFKPKFEGSSIEFIMDNPYISFNVTMDKSRVLQVISNFLTNSIKYTKSGYIKMGFYSENNGINFYVEDTGIGIKKEAQYKIFQPFEKLNNFSHGSGLGLSICKAMVESLNGKIGFESEESKGSIFWAWLPL